MRSVTLIMCLAATVGLCSCNKEPEEGSKEYFLAIIDANHQAYLENDKAKMQQAHDPEAWEQTLQLVKFHKGKETPRPKREEHYKHLTEKLKDRKDFKVETHGNWARLIRRGPERTFQAIFRKNQGRWGIVRQSDHPTPQPGDKKSSMFGGNINDMWPPKADYFFLPPIELMIRKSPKPPWKGYIGRCEFAIKNIGKETIPARVLKQHFGSICWRNNDMLIGSSVHCDDFKDLPAGEELVIHDDNIKMNKTGKYEIQWVEGKYLSNLVKITVTRK